MKSLLSTILVILIFSFYLVAQDSAESSAMNEAVSYAMNMNLLEASGMVFGLLCVFFLINENILTFVCGIIYVLISFVIFWEARLYGDFLLHIVFLVLNAYGWYNWSKGNREAQDQPLQVSSDSMQQNMILLVVSIIGIVLFAQLLILGPSWIDGMQAASLPYWDSTTSVLSITGMWLTTKKKIENWYYWLIVDILATGIYVYKELYFYGILYFVYIFLAVAGYMAWKRSMDESQQAIAV